MKTKSSKYNRNQFLFIGIVIIAGFIAEVVYDYKDNLLQIPMENKATKETAWVACKGEAQRFFYGINKEGGWMNISFLTPFDRILACLGLLLLLYFVWTTKRNGYFKKNQIEVIDNLEFVMYFIWGFKLFLRAILSVRMDLDGFRLDKSYYFGVIFLIAALFFRILKELVSTGNELKETQELTV